MIIILDDTFIDRHKYSDVAFLDEEKYKNACIVKSIIKTTELEDVEEQLSQCNLFCNHKTLQLYDLKGNPLNNEINSKKRESFLNIVAKKNISRIEFSKVLETNIEASKIDKDLFYTNLKAFLDHYIESNIIETKILFYGIDFQEQEKMAAIQNALLEIRLSQGNEFKTNLLILKGLQLVYGKSNTEGMIEYWLENNTTKSEIINEINKQIS